MDLVLINCKLCYTFGLNEDNKNLTAEDIVDSLEGKIFDVIYVSHNKENFIDPSKGIDLCRKLFSDITKICWLLREISRKISFKKYAASRVY